MSQITVAPGIWIDAEPDQHADPEDEDEHTNSGCLISLDAVQDAIDSYSWRMGL